jgi:hypothetical protein
MKVGIGRVLNYDLRKQIGDAARRIEAASSVAALHDDPKIKALMKRWRDLTQATARARKALDDALETRKSEVTGEDRRFIEQAREANPELLMIEDPDGYAMPVICMASGLAVFASDRIIGDPEAGYVVLKCALRYLSSY